MLEHRAPPPLSLIIPIQKLGHGCRALYHDSALSIGSQSSAQALSFFVQSLNFIICHRTVFTDFRLVLPLTIYPNPLIQSVILNRAPKQPPQTICFNMETRRLCTGCRTEKDITQFMAPGRPIPWKTCQACRQRGDKVRVQPLY